MNEFDKYDYKIMTGVNVNINELLANQIEADEVPPWEPREGYELSKCGNLGCGADMWLGPRQLLALGMASEGEYILLCFRCSTAMMRMTGAGMDDVHHFGG